MLLAITAVPARAQAPPTGAARALHLDSAALSTPLRRLHEAEHRLASGASGSLPVHLQRLGALYLVAVEDEDLLDTGFAVIDSMRARFAAAETPWLDARLDGYAGAFTVLRAKHAFWPHHRLSHVKSGLRLLDLAVASSPDDAVLRYLRLISGFYLPGLFGRGDEVDADFDALARLLPFTPSDFPGEMYGTVIRFVLDNGEPAPARAVELRALLGSG